MLAKSHSHRMEGIHFAVDTSLIETLEESICSHHHRLQYCHRTQHIVHMSSFASPHTLMASVNV